MPNPIFFTACLLAICLPILSVQLPRTALYTRLRSKRLEPRSARCKTTKCTAETTTNDTTTPPQHQPQDKKHDLSSPPSSELVRRRPAAPRYQDKAAQSFDGTHSGAASAEEEGHVSPSRKPWDPPFPRRESVKVGSWRILPPAPMREKREMSVRGGKGVEGVDGEGGVEQGGLAPQMRGGGKEGQGREQVVQGGKLKGMVVVWGGVAVMALLLFLTAFAVLIAHCLAWFLVYKTEARLGEARRGIMTSGDMRLCLCAA
ncbi:hypothetical protein J1614_003910 [Plenodomus biglobosus]|nr:hypothetical protein J1614_003910 [Plenodomus biglobosus]